jgi:hypothetical protein
MIDLGTAEWLGTVEDREHMEEVLNYIYDRHGGEPEVISCLLLQEKSSRCLVSLTSRY